MGEDYHTAYPFGSTLAAVSLPCTSRMRFVRLLRLLRHVE